LPDVGLLTRIDEGDAPIVYVASQELDLPAALPPARPSLSRDVEGFLLGL
jgi:hypothetical protein